MAGLATSLGAGAASNSFNQIAGADLLFVFGSNTTEGHPVVSFEINRAVRNGTRLIVADPRRIELVDMANHWLALKSGGNIALLNAMANVIVQERLFNRAFVEERAEGFAAFCDWIARFTPESVEGITGIAPDSVRIAARLYAKAERAMIIYGLGVTEHRNGTENAMAIANLALLCGQIGRRSTGIMALRGQNNVQGATDMGPLPATLPGYQPVNNPSIRQKFEQAWSIALPTEPGLKSVEMLDAAKNGALKALFILGEDPAHTQPNCTHVREALSALDFLVVCDIFPTETSRFAHVILPGASFAEKDGTFTNGERRIQRIRQAIDPLGGMAEWQMICELSRRMGYSMQYRHPSEVMDEIASLVPIYGGISYDRLGTGGIQWPCPTRDHPGTETLYEEVFSRPSGKALFVELDPKPAGEQPDTDYPFVLITGRRRQHYNNGSMTRRIPEIMELWPEELLEMHPDDADRLGLSDSGRVRVSSRRGSIEVRLQITERSPQGSVFLAFHHLDAMTNLLTSEHRDPVTGTPEYKACAVSVERVS